MAFEAQHRSFRFLAPVRAQLDGPALPSRSVDVGWSPSRSRSSRGRSIPERGVERRRAVLDELYRRSVTLPFEEGRR
jgi:hypothetical protein